MKLVGDRTDDVEAFKRGDRERLLNLPKGKTFGNFALAAVSARVTRLTGTPANLGEFMLSNIDEVRDQWSHKFARREQADLIRKAGKARLANRNAGARRSLMFLSGDIHIGCIFDLTSLVPPFKAVSLTSSAISNTEDTSFVLGIVRRRGGERRLRDQVEAARRRARLQLRRRAGDPHGARRRAPRRARTRGQRVRRRPRPIRLALGRKRRSM